MSKDDKEEFEQSVVKVDMLNLHEEWAKQPEMFHQYAQELASAREAVNTAKAKMELVEAELSNSVRKDPEAYGLEKATEKGVEFCVREQPAYQASVKRYNAARHKQDLAQAVVDALHHKKAALENLVSLHAMDYYSEPKPKDPATKRRK